MRGPILMGHLVGLKTLWDLESCFVQWDFIKKRYFPQRSHFVHFLTNIQK